MARSPLRIRGPGMMAPRINQYGEAGRVYTPSQGQRGRVYTSQQVKKEQLKDTQRETFRGKTTIAKLRRT